jgi:ATP-binding dynein motor region
VTQKGLEEQLLGRVIGKEQQALEEQLSEVLEEVNSNTKALLALVRSQLLSSVLPLSYIAATSLLAVKSVAAAATCSAGMS